MSAETPHIPLFTANALHWSPGAERLHTSERLYYSDSFLTAFTGTVSEVREMKGTGESLWKLSFDRTAFYPTSGGQPFDTGLLRAISHGGATEIAVEQVEEDEEGKVWHFVSKPLAVGTPVDGHLNWSRRFDHMQQHTGQHLLSAVFLRELEAPTVSFHLGETTSTIDLAIGVPAHHSLERIERIANEIIGEDRLVSSKYVSRDEADVLLAAGGLRKLPDRQGTIRLIEIANYDLNACGGTHVRSTGQIGGLLLRKMEKVSRGVRIELACGLRAVRIARADAAILNETAALLSTGATELPEAIGRLMTEKKINAKERQKLREDLAKLEGAQIAADVSIESGVRLVVRAWKDRDRDYVKLLASRTATVSATVALFCAQDADPVRVFLARSRDLDFDCGRILRESLAQLGLRGGGSPDLAQGDIPALQQQALLDSITETIRGAAAKHKDA
jgi:alanyl-tRNA synthetase